jgi:hypothetical protein
MPLQSLLSEPANAPGNSRSRKGDAHAAELVSYFIIQGVVR